LCSAQNRCRTRRQNTLKWRRAWPQRSETVPPPARTRHHDREGVPQRPPSRVDCRYGSARHSLPRGYGAARIRATIPTAGSLGESRSARIPEMRYPSLGKLPCIPLSISPLLPAVPPLDVRRGTSRWMSGLRPVKRSYVDGNRNPVPQTDRRLFAVTRRVDAHACSSAFLPFLHCESKACSSWIRLSRTSWLPLGLARTPRFVRPSRSPRQIVLDEQPT